MLAAIELDHELGAVTGEIRDVAAKRCLPAKMKFDAMFGCACFSRIVSQV